MFLQIIQGTIADRATFEHEADRWAAELKPSAAGFIGGTRGVTPDGIGVLVARFESDEAARANSDRPETTEWWRSMEKAFDAASFKESYEVDTMLGGGSDDAGFVQLIQGRVKDKSAARAMLIGAEGQLVQGRPDILGGLMVWFGNSGEFTQVMYFRSEEEARAGELGEAEEELDEQYRDLMEGEPTFLDLPNPSFT